MKIQGSSIIESMLAMVIIGIVISASITLFVSLRKDSFLERDQKAYLKCSHWFTETLEKNEYLDDKQTYESFDLVREITNKENLNCIELKVVAYDKFGEQIIERKRLVSKK